MRRLVPLLGVLALSVAAIVWAWSAQDAEVPVADSAPRRQPPATASVRRPTPEPPAPVTLAPPRSPEEQLDGVARRVRTLLRSGRHDEALALLEAWQTRCPDVFEACATRDLLVEVRAAVERAQAATKAGADVVARRFEASRDVAALAPDDASRARLKRHVELFVPRSEGDRGSASLGGGADGDWLAGLYAAHVGSERSWPKEAPLLGVADPEAAEGRRMEQLHRLAERGATELLEPLHGALLWLALHQGDDGRISDPAVKARCKALGHGEPNGKGNCLEAWGQGNRRNETAATALSLLAFLDFRDQDAKEVFEPTIARATRWLAAEQKEDGTFGGGRDYYVTAMSLMALAQAAGSANSDELREVVADGLEALYARRGPTGGYRYGPKQPGDVSVSGWVAQAVEAARAAKVPVPEGMEEDLRRFLDHVWLLEWRFTYTERGRERSSLFPAGMLMGHILWEDPLDRVLDTWRTWLAKNRKISELYTLYYGVRMALLLEGRLADPWRTAVGELAASQLHEGHAAGTFKRPKFGWVRQYGSVIHTALATLTLEHALYAR